MTDPIARIEAALGRLGEEHEPPVGWEARVLAAASTSTHTGTEPTQRKWWWFAVPAIALAVVIILVVGRPPRDQPLQLAYTVENSGTVVRGPEPHIGDVVHAVAIGGGPHRAVWIYRNDRLVAVCPGPAQCRISGDSTIVDLALRSLGEYQIVALTSTSPAPVPTGRFDTDVANARTAGAVEIKPFTVR